MPTSPRRPESGPFVRNADSPAPSCRWHRTLHVVLADNQRKQGREEAAVSAAMAAYTKLGWEPHRCSICDAGISRREEPTATLPVSPPADIPLDQWRLAELTTILEITATRRLDTALLQHRVVQTLTLCLCNGLSRRLAEAGGRLMLCPRMSDGDLTLRAWTPSDSAVVLEAFATSDMANQRSQPIDTPKAAEQWINDRAADLRADQSYAWAVHVRDIGVVGSVAASAVDRNHETAWMSYWTIAQYRGHGYSSRSLALLTRWCFEHLELYRLELGHRTVNRPSCLVARNAGYAVEGLERAKLRYGNRRYDVELHARLRTD